MRLILSVIAGAALLTALAAGHVGKSLAKVAPAAAEPRAAADAGPPPLETTVTVDAGRAATQAIEAGATADAGSAATPAIAGQAGADAGAPAQASEPEPKPAVDPKLEAERQREVERLRAELQAKQQVELAQLAQLKEANQQLDQLRADLSAEADAQREAERKRAEHIAANWQASVNLYALDLQLQAGDTNVLSTIAEAEGVVGPSAQLNLAAAREALANKDLLAARTFLLRAALDARDLR